MKKRNKGKSKKKEFWGLLKDVRMKKGKEWIETYQGKNIITSYSKTFGLNLKNSKKELQMLGAKISQEEEKYVTRIMKEKKQAKLRKKEKKRNEALKELIESDETFAFIAGCTEGGAPFGITHEE
ncbi:MULTISPECIES: hypothetical protein [Bacillus]|uniref:hypothetical protein n=1 Tax=Bacillus TaxID=1386 RepID=UPI000BB8CAD5|nr:MULTISPECIES: hypothetical protein [Bacillus]